VRLPHEQRLDVIDRINGGLTIHWWLKQKTGGALPQAPPFGYVSSPHVTASPVGEASAAQNYAQLNKGCK